MTLKTFRLSCEYIIRQIAESDGLITLGHLGLFVFLSLNQSERYIFQSLSRATGISEKTLHVYIKVLESLNLVKRESDRTGVRFVFPEGQIYPSKSYYSKLPIFSYTIISNIKEEEKKDKKNEKIMELHEEIINDLNSVSGRNFRLSASDTIKKISWLLAHDYTLDDFKKVHRAKLDWLTSPKMSAYYRPKTLYSQENFESYLNERKVVDASKATTTKWTAPDKVKKTSTQREKLEKKWGAE